MIPNVNEKWETRTGCRGNKIKGISAVGVGALGDYFLFMRGKRLLPKGYGNIQDQSQTEKKIKGAGI